MTKKNKSAVFHDPGALAFLAKSLSDENRLRILLCVRDGKKSVSRIVEEVSLSQPLVSHHLKELKRSLLVQVERKGPFIYYELADARIVEILEQMAELADDLLSNRKSF
ncbi:MAG: metalloregulator ArsR/SmtB family transcription factor [Thermodesulfobacteriota bacterium]|nr:metalloregulator ArsR/SmtB family transcription factor [Thermodesulfobacteriota bacterium]